KVWSARVAMTAMPQLVSIYNALGGACAVILGLNAVYSDQPVDTMFLAIVLIVGGVFGATAFTGSLVAFMKLDGRKLPPPVVMHKYIAQALLLVMSALAVAYIAMGPTVLPFPTVLLAISIAALLYG